MGFVLNYIVKTSDKRVSSYDTLKRFIDEREQDTFGEFEDHKSETVIVNYKDKYAEDAPLKLGFRTINKQDITNFHDKSRFRYFLDGSRHVYKVGDVLISGTVYPVVAGQIVVGCCIRNGRAMNQFRHTRSIVLAMPSIYDSDNHGRNFFRKKCDDLNNAIQADDNIFPKTNIDAIIPYRIDGDLKTGRNLIRTRKSDAVKHNLCKLVKPRGLCKTLLYGISIN